MMEERPENLKGSMYFDNAATSFPKPETVYTEVDRFLRTSAANPGRSGHGMAVEAERVVVRTRARLARLIGAPRPDNVVFTLNATHALNQALKGWLRPGDTVVTTALEHNSVARPLRSLERAGVRLIRVPCPQGKFDLETFLEAIRPGVRLVAMTHASNVTGEILPVEAVGASCRERGVRLLVDAAQTAGAHPLHVREMGIDLLALPGHKGLFGPPGTGALYVAEGLELAPLWEGGTGSRSESDAQPETTPDRFESGTQNTAGLAGLGAGLAWIEETGLAAIRQREENRVAHLWEGLSQLTAVRLLGPPPGAERAAVVSFTLEGWEPTDVAAVLDQSFEIQCRPGLHCSPWAHESLGTLPGGTIRLSPGYFNTEDEVEAVIRAVEALGAS